MALWLLGYDASMLLELREISMHRLHVFEHLLFDVSTLGRFLLLGFISLRSGYWIDYVISASAKIDLFLKCDWRVDGTTSAVLKSGFVWIRPLWTSRRLWSFEISCSRSYSQSSLNPLLACGQSVRPPSKSYLIPELNHCKSSPKPSAAQFQPSHVKCWRIPCCAEDLSPAATVALPRTPLSPWAAGPSPLLSLPPRTKSRTIQIEIKNIN